MDRQTYQAYRTALLAVRRQVRIVHHLSGRIRVEFRPDGADATSLPVNGSGGLAAVRALLPGIRSLRLNALAGSVVLEYDHQLYPAHLVDAFFRTTSTEEAGDLLDRLYSRNLNTKENAHE
ncbi:hypothetical protein [Desulfobulbus elongatus]|uniref:hypothetical protein n=1 Tax=Desulfobulbus elongatus TaxID=53332 RepID=UPI00054EAF84|nr:hypothetical protein [Desulfobulbus elongatus]